MVVDGLIVARVYDVVSAQSSFALQSRNLGA